MHPKKGSSPDQEVPLSLGGRIETGGAINSERMNAFLNDSGSESMDLIASEEIPSGWVGTAPGVGFFILGLIEALADFALEDASTSAARGFLRLSPE